ncbi:trypsin-like peptidase domain-containing protein [Luteococcus sp. Sow4_B9]|uniref:S1C family serine protease n=1 Tax=Luteococcus sp. Sow4_B9 TaxID=3438792 RepID=UPI003F98BC6B
MTHQGHGQQPTNQPNDDWFWSRPQPEEPSTQAQTEHTQVIPMEDTQVVPLQDTQVIPVEDLAAGGAVTGASAAPHSAAAPGVETTSVDPTWAPPSGQPWQAALTEAPSTGQPAQAQAQVPGVGAGEVPTPDAGGSQIPVAGQVPPNPWREQELPQTPWELSAEPGWGGSVPPGNHSASGSQTQSGANPQPDGWPAPQTVPGPDGMPGTWYVQGSAPAPKRRRGGTMLAVLATGVVAGAVMVGGMDVVRSGNPSPSAAQPAQTEQAGGADGSTQDPTGQDDGSLPAEGSPRDPWGTADESDSQDSEPGAEPTRASKDQSRGVVLIRAASNTGRGAGTGMVVSQDGYVLTNYHVVQSSTRVDVQLATTGRGYTADVIGHDPVNDVALLKLEGAKDLETVTFDDDQLAVGDEVTAVGNANGQGYLSGAAGRVRELNSSITVANENAASGQEELSDVIKTSAAAQPGDSGGPMFDAEGEVVGMTTAGQTASSGIRTQSVTVASYAVPIERARKIIEEIQQGKEEGTTRVGPRAYLGVSVQTLEGRSMVVSSVVQDGPAARVGLQRGDRITSIDGMDVTTHASLSDKLAEHEPGDSVEIGWTDAAGQERRGTVELGESPVN